MINNIISYEEAFEQGSEYAGGKGWNLGRLKRYGFRVPDGGVITAVVYKQFLYNPEIKKFIDIVNSNTINDFYNESLKANLSNLEKLIINTEFAPDIIESIKDYLLKNNLYNEYLAIRSSATAEDSDSASFAGIHSSYLNIKGIDEILLSVKKCFASLWTPQAIAYRSSKILNGLELACAVVICKMVTGINSKEPDFAGVAFSCDPLTGRRDQFKINSTTGLAEKLVSGNINPEETTVTITPYQNIIEYKKGDSGKFLNETQTQTLIRLINRIFWALGDGLKHQDIEWVFDGKEFWIVQARPVTNLPFPTFKEIASLPVIWSNGNLKDALPNIANPMSRSNLQEMVAHMLYYPFKEIGFEFPQGEEVVRRFYGKFYLDMTMLQYVLAMAIGVSPADTNKTTGGHQPEIKIKRLNFSEKLKIQKNLRKLFSLLRKNNKTIIAEINRFTNLMNKEKKVDVSKFSNQEMMEFTIKMKKLTYEFSEKFQLVNNYSGAFQPMLDNLLKKAVGEKAMQIGSGLMAGTDNVVSAEQGYEIYTLANLARKDLAAKAFFEQQPFIVNNWQQLGPNSIFYKGMLEYLQKFGHRCVYEGDITNPRWNENQTFIIEQVKQIIVDNETIDFDPRAKAHQIRINAENEIKKLPIYYRVPINFFANLCRKGYATRELAKSTLCRSAEIQRIYLLDVGNRMVRDNLIDKTEDIFYLTEVDVNSYIYSEWDGLGARDLINDRKTEMIQLEKEKPLDYFITDKNYNLIKMESTDFNVPVIESNKQKN